MAYQELNERDLVEIRQALAQPTLVEAIRAVDQTLASMGYVRLQSFISREVSSLSKENKKNAYYKAAAHFSHRGAKDSPGSINAFRMQKLRYISFKIPGYCI